MTHTYRRLVLGAAFLMLASGAAFTYAQSAVTLPADLIAVMSTYAVSGFDAIAVDEHMPPGRLNLEAAART